MNRIKHAGPPTSYEEVLAEIATLAARPELAERSKQDQRVREFLTVTLDPLEHKVFILHYGEEMPLDAITRLLTLHNPSGAKAYIVSAKRKIAKSRAASPFRLRGGTR